MNAERDRRRVLWQQRLLGSIAVAILWCMVAYSRVDVEVEREDIPVILDEKSLVKVYEDHKVSPFLCKSFNLNMYITKAIDCDIKGYARLSRAFQIENCHAATRTHENAKEVKDKILKLSLADAFVFFRGAAALFAYNMMCADPHYRRKVTGMPRVISNGDCHPENFGVMVQANGRLVWGVNDFDQAFQTPFSWDLKRGATGFFIGCTTRLWNATICRAISARFVDAYLEVVRRKSRAFGNDERFLEGSTLTQSYKTISELFQKSRARESTKKTLKWLRKKVKVDLKQKQFIRTDEIVPLDSAYIPEFQESIDAYLYHGVSALAKFANDGFYKVKAVAQKFGSGTGSIGLNRYYILIEGRNEKYGNIVLEMKQETNSVLESFFRYKYTASQEGKRATDAEHSAWPYANLFYGWTTYRNNSFIVREKSLHHVSADLEEYSKEEYLEYAQAAGKALGFYHIRARCPNHYCKLEDQSAVDLETSRLIQEYLNKYKGDFARMITTFAEAETKRQIEAWNLLKSFVRHTEISGGDVLDILADSMS